MNQERLKQLVGYDQETGTPELAHEAYVSAKRTLHAGNTL